MGAACTVPLAVFNGCASGTINARTRISVMRGKDIIALLS
jgi:hypothetical protein